MEKLVSSKVLKKAGRLPLQPSHVLNRRGFNKLTNSCAVTSAEHSAVDSDDAFL